MNFPPVTSPADKAVHSKAPAGTFGSHAAADSTANPNLSLGLVAQGTSAYGFSLTPEVKSADVPVTTVVDWGDGQTSTTKSTGGSQDKSTHSYAKLGTYTITVTATDESANQVVNKMTVTTYGSLYTPYGPTRLLDTRSSGVQPYTNARVQIGGNGGIPVGVTAVALNVTVTNATTAGHITAYGEGTTRPTTSNLNFNAGQTVPNLVIVPVGANGYVDLYNGGWGSVDLIADVAGYFSSSSTSGYTSLASTRIADTRDGTGTSAAGQLGAGASFSLPIAGGAGGQLPVSGVTSVALNVTVTNPRSAGFLTVYPGGQTAPTASNVNFVADQTVANSVIAPVGADGRIQIKNGGWQPADVIVDVVGYYSAASRSAYLPASPVRLIDTREEVEGPLLRSQYYPVPLGKDLPTVTGFVLNTTVTNTTGVGFLAVTPDPNSWDSYLNGTAYVPNRQPGSVLNWQRAQTVPNLVQASSGSTGVIDFWNVSDGSADLIVDLFGFYTTD
ncbi:PKD domain-containing protein [Streptomyces sp. CB03911]|uniref:PKD domain-containing protein n=1 Tax=Streptomyces sp. CB03911 TaxID=1804758 RepID=UPI0009405E5F|nr:PKD domain-containing protein [Streptomyces sp. CB03911]